MSERPKILLIGNGLNLSFVGSKDTNQILENEYVKKYGSSMPETVDEMPFPMKAVVATKDDVASCMDELADAFVNTPVYEAQRELIKSILDVDFDSILTTNYSLEFEKSTINNFSKGKLYSHYNQPKTIGLTTPQKNFGIFQSVELPYKNKPSLWHIHGIAVRKKSMVMGQEYYGKLLREVVDRTGKMMKEYKTAQTCNRIFEPKTWVDLFLLGDVHCFGFNLDLSEADIWWLLSYKKRNFPESKFFYYSTSLKEEKKKLLECYNVKMPEIAKVRGYIQYYKDVCSYIKSGDWNEL